MQVLKFLKKKFNAKYNTIIKFWYINEMCKNKRNYYKGVFFRANKHFLIFQIQDIFNMLQFTHGMEQI